MCPVRSIFRNSLGRSESGSFWVAILNSGCLWQVFRTLDAPGPQRAHLFIISRHGAWVLVLKKAPLVILMGSQDLCTLHEEVVRQAN